MVSTCLKLRMGCIIGGNIQKIFIYSVYHFVMYEIMTGILPMVKIIIILLVFTAPLFHYEFLYTFFPSKAPPHFDIDFEYWVSQATSLYGVLILFVYDCYLSFLITD